MTFKHDTSSIPIQSEYDVHDFLSDMKIFQEMGYALLSEKFSFSIINAITMSGSNTHQTNKLVFLNLVVGGVMQKFATAVEES